MTQLDMGLEPVHTIKNGVCTACGYPPRNGASCDNPACIANPTLSEAHKAHLHAAAEKARRERDAFETRQRERAELRRAGFTTIF